MASWKVGRIQWVLLAGVALAGLACSSDESNGIRGSSHGGGGSSVAGSGGGGLGGTGGETGGAAGQDAGAPGGQGGVAPDGGAGNAGTSGAGTGGGGTGGSANDGGPPDAPMEAGACNSANPAPDIDPWMQRNPSGGFGGLQTVQGGGHTDLLLDSPKHLVQIGVRLDWGGTVVFFGLKGKPHSNVIDANDTGRELQLAIYDPSRSHQPCAATATCQTHPASCGNSITYLGWNPVQGGDECNRGAPVKSHGRKGDAMDIVIQPLQWNPQWDRKDCSKGSCSSDPARPVDVLYHMQYRFLNDNVVEIATEVISHESISHPVTGQEFPTLYVAHGKVGPDLPHLLDSAGNQVSIQKPANDGFFVTSFQSTEPWVSWQKPQHDYGVGIAMDQGIRHWQAWRGDGKTAPYFHNVRAHISFGLPAGGTVRGVSYLALGAYGDVAKWLRRVLKHRAPFGWVDEPASGKDTTVKLGGSVHVRGWVLDSSPVDHVVVRMDGVQLGKVDVTVKRDDVCRVYPAYAGCPKVGYDGSVKVVGVQKCRHLMQVVGVDGDGNERVLGERVVLVQ